MILPYGQSIERIFTIDEETIERILIVDQRYASLVRDRL